MNFYHISKTDGQGSHKEQSVFFKAACDDKDIIYVRIVEGDRESLDYEKMCPESSDIVYRSARGTWAETLERHLLRGGAKNIKKDSINNCFGSSYHAMLNAGLPVIPSVEFIPKKKKDVLAVSKYLGGFPLVIKVSGGMEGMGIIRVDGIESFNSILDYLRNGTSSNIRLMQYIEHDYYARLVVVGDKVVAAATDIAPVGDFRTNAYGPRKKESEVFIVSESMEESAVRATHSLGVKTGGVDLLFSKSGKFYIAEVNVPFNYAETQEITGIDIASHIVEELSN